MAKLHILALSAIAFVSPAFAQFHVVPPGYENTTGNVSFLGPLTSTARSYQLMIHEDLLTDLVGLPLNGLTWRAHPSATSDWPGSAMTFADYDIYLGQSVAPINGTLTFADNIVGSLTQVRSGPLTIQPGSFPSGGSPNAWGSNIDFTPWIYNGGHLLVEIRHSGNGAGTAGNRSIDAVGTSVPGYGTLFRAVWQSSYTPTTGLQGNFGIIRFSVVPGPSALMAMATMSLFGIRRRRRS